MISSRQRRLIENAGAFDVSGAQPGTVTPPAPAAPAAPPAPATPQDSSNVAVSGSPDVDKAESLSQAQGKLDDMQAQLAEISALVKQADSPTGELLDKFSGELVEIRNAVAIKLQKLGPSVDADVASGASVQSPQVPAQPAPPPASIPAPAAAPEQVPAMESKFEAHLNNVFGEDGVTKERRSTSQEMDEVVQRTKHQGPKKGNPPKTHGKSEADFAAKDVTGNGYGTASGGFG